ncbi:MAG TPA: hypothetical protein VF802_01785 [Candidatus Limnocylindrales bacterium]
MDLSIAAGPDRSGRRRSEPDDALPPREALVVAVVIVLAMFAVYALSDAARDSPYNHFVRQADAFLHGRAAIQLPDPTQPDAPANGYFQDAMPVLGPDGQPTGEALIPFPPLPAIILVPFVAVFGLATNAQWIATILAALAVGLAFRVLGRLRIGPGARLLATLFLGVGTVFWYAAEVGTTWFIAHVVAVLVTFLALDTALAADDGGDLGSDGDEATVDIRNPSAVATRGAGSPRPSGLLGLLGLLDRRQVLAGFLLGLAATARLTVALGAPFLVFVGGGGSWPRRTISAGLGMAVPLMALAAFNVATTGHVFHPAYDYQYQMEASGYPQLGYNPDWSIEDVRYLPQNLVLMLAGLPSILPACDPGAPRGLFDQACPFLRPEPIGMSLLLVSPGWLLALPALRGWGVSRLVTGSVLAVAAIAVVNLMHFSQGWVQFGYRFSNDFAPFGLLLVALGIDRIGARRPLALGLVGLSVAVNLWGVIWAGILGW